MSTVIAEEELAVGVGETALNCATSLVSPDLLAGLGLERVNRPVLTSEIDNAVAHQWRALAAAWQISRPKNLFLGWVERYDLASIGALHTDQDRAVRNAINISR